MDKEHPFVEICSYLRDLCHDIFGNLPTFSEGIYSFADMGGREKKRKVESLTCSVRVEEKSTCLCCGVICAIYRSKVLNNRLTARHFISGA